MAQSEQKKNEFPSELKERVKAFHEKLLVGLKNLKRIYEFF